MSKYGFVSGPYFPAFGLNTESEYVCLRIQSKCQKIRTRNNSVFGHFSRSGDGVHFWLRSDTIFGRWKPFKNHEKCFLFHFKSSLRSQDIYVFLSWLFVYAAKQLDKKYKVNLKSYDVTAWLTNICNTHIVQYLEK